jgi:hemerythrin superfamily protein
MNAIDLLEAQHRQIERLLHEVEEAPGEGPKRNRFGELADALAIHTAIEEQHFYPAVERQRSEEMVLIALDQHLAIKRALGELRRLDVNDPRFEGRLSALSSLVSRHIAEEEDDLFPRVAEAMGGPALATLGRTMLNAADDLAERPEAPLGV